MKVGGALGFFCQHTYPHNSKNFQNLLLDALVGINIVLQSIFTSLDIKCEFRPMLKASEFIPSKDQDIHFQYELELESYEDDP